MVVSYGGLAAASRVSRLYGYKSGKSAGLSVPWPRIGGVSNEIPPRLERLARNQAGVVSRQQALKAGLTRGMIDTKVKSGWWVLVHAGVYQIFTGHITREARLWAAILYAGQGAYLSHRTAAQINKLTDDESPVIDVTIPSNRRVKAPEGVSIHLSSHKAMVWRPPGVPAYRINASLWLE